MIRALFRWAIAGLVLAGCFVKNGYDPCDGKKAGDTCTRCAPGDADCVETQEVRQCNAAGTCIAGGSSKVDTRNDGHSWLIDRGGGFCLSWTGVVESPDGGLWLGAGDGLFALGASNPEKALLIDRTAIERGGVRAMSKVGNDVFVTFGVPEVVRFGLGRSRTSMGAGTSTPLAVSDNGCLAMRRDDDLVARLPGDDGHEKTVALPRPTNGFTLGVDAAVGLIDSMLVRTYRRAEGLGALYRVSCPGLHVSEVATGDAVQYLRSFTRDDDGRVWAIERIDADVSSRRLMRSEDDGVTWNAVEVPHGWQSAAYAIRGRWVVVAPPKLEAVLLSTDGGKTWTVDPVETHTSVRGFETMSVFVSNEGVITAGANCNYLVHRRLPITK